MCRIGWLLIMVAAALIVRLRLLRGRQLWVLGMRLWMGMGGMRMRKRVWRIGAVEVAAKSIVKGLADCCGISYGLMAVARMVYLAWDD
jgi:hypothetical protein